MSLFFQSLNARLPQQQFLRLLIRKAGTQADLFLCRWNQSAVLSPEVPFSIIISIRFQFLQLLAVNF